MRLLARILLSGAVALASGHLMLAQHGGGHASAGGGYAGGGHMGAAHFGAPAGAARGNSFAARAPGSYYSSSWSHFGSGNAYRRGYRPGYAYRYSRYPFPYFFTPYYYPFLSYDNGFYDDSSYPSSYPYDSGDNGQYPPMEPQEDLMQNQPPPYQPYAGPNYPAPYPPPVPYAYQAPAAQPAELPPAPPVTIVLHDGQKFQVQSYAIMGQTFWDFSKQPVRKIPLSNIDVAASTKATIDSGAEFPAIQSGK